MPASAYAQTVMQLLGSKCRKCGQREMGEIGNGGRPGSKQLLVIHHLDGNRRNNDPANLEVLCRKCHRAVHRRKGPIEKDEIDQRRRKRRGDPFKTVQINIYAHPDWVREVDENSRWLSRAQGRRVSRSEYIVMAVREFMKPYGRRRKAYQKEWAKRREESLNRTKEAINNGDGEGVLEGLSSFFTNPPSKQYIEALQTDGNRFVNMGYGLLEEAASWKEIALVEGEE